MDVTAVEGTAESRPYAGVEGDKNQQGELFGVKVRPLAPSPFLPDTAASQNIFKLSDSSSMTKKAIMECEEAEQDWALENLGQDLIEKLSLDSDTKLAMDDLFSSGAGYVFAHPDRFERLLILQVGEGMKRRMKSCPHLLVRRSCGVMCVPSFSRLNES